MSRLWIFDLDGTLIDSEKAIKECYLAVGKELLPERQEFIKNMVIGPTLDDSLKMILREHDQKLLKTFKKKFIGLYDEKIVFKTKQYRNVENVLNYLKELGNHMIIVTNKRYTATKKLINYYKWNKFFKKIYCLDQFPNYSSKSILIREEIEIKNDFKEIFFVGDTITDAIAAHDNKIHFIFASYGYGKQQDFSDIPIFTSINNIEEILSI